MELELATVEVPQIENYRCYRQFLRDFYTYKKAVRASFSFRQFAQKAEIKSPNYLQLVMQGKRNLSSDKALSVARAMKLTSFEQHYFVALVRVDNAKDDKSKEQAQRELLITSRHLSAKKLPQVQREILRSWYHLVVRELVCLSDFEPSGEWISHKLRRLLTPSEAEAAFENLCTAGFVKKEDGRWVQSDPVLTTGEAFDLEMITQHHKDTLKVWSKSLFDFDGNERELGLLNIPIAKSKIPELQKRIGDFQNEIIGWLKDEDKPEQVVQLGVYMIPITN